MGFSSGQILYLCQSAFPHLLEILYLHAAKQNIHQFLASPCTILQMFGESCLHYSITRKKEKEEKSLFPVFLFKSLKAITAPEELKQIQPSMQYFFLSSLSRTVKISKQGA